MQTVALFLSFSIVHSLLQHVTLVHSSWAWGWAWAWAWTCSVGLAALNRPVLEFLLCTVALLFLLFLEEIEHTAVLAAKAGWAVFVGRVVVLGQERRG